MKTVLEPVIKSFKDVSQDETKTMTETYKENNTALSNSNKKLLEMMKDRGMLASCLLSPLSKISNSEQTSQFKLVKDSDLNRAIDILINKTIPVTLIDNLLTFRDTDKKFKLEENLLKVVTKTTKRYILLIYRIKN